MCQFSFTSSGPPGLSISAFQLFSSSVIVAIISYFFWCFALLIASPWLLTWKVLGCLGVHSTCWVGFGRVSAKNKWGISGLPQSCDTAAAQPQGHAAAKGCNGLDCQEWNIFSFLKFFFFFFKIYPKIRKVYYETLSPRTGISSVLFI